MAKNFFISKLDLREEKIQVLSPSLPLACSSRPHQRPHQCRPSGLHSCFPGLCDENLPLALWLLKEQSPGWQSQGSLGASFLLTLSRNGFPAPASKTGSSLSHGVGPRSQIRTNPFSKHTPGSQSHDPTCWLGLALGAERPGSLDSSPCSPSKMLCDLGRSLRFSGPQVPHED